jgi:hypothetical protein
MSDMTPDEQQQMARDIREIKQAVVGDKSIGLNGLVNDMAEMKQFRSGILVKVAFVAGVVAAVITGGKTVMAKLFGSL